MYNEIERPTAILNPTIVKRNIRRMADKARRSGVRFRPHFKTHQSAVVGEWFRAEGVNAITVSSVDMAVYFAAHGWTDITIAFPTNWRQIAKINDLAGRIQLNLLVESAETVAFLQRELTHPVRAWIKVDTGYGRTGVPWDDAARMEQLATAFKTASQLTVTGVLAHDGQTYSLMGSRMIRTIHRTTVDRLNQVSQQWASWGFPNVEVSIGDTPSCSLLEEFKNVQEIRPGNFVFYDLQQVSIGSCTANDVGVAVACPVVAKHPERNLIIIYGGAVHLSKEYDDGWLFGGVALPQENGWSAPLPQTKVVRLSQEHGAIRTTPELLNQIQLGDLLMILPIHSCLTVDALKGYRTPAGEVIEMMRL